MAKVRAWVGRTVLLRGPLGPCVPAVLLQGSRGPCLPAVLLRGPRVPASQQCSFGGLGDPVSWQRSCWGPGVPVSWTALLRGPGGPCVFASSADRAAPSPGPVGPLRPLTPASSRARSVATLVPPRSGAVLTHPEASPPRPPPCCLPGPLALGVSVRLSVPDAGAPSWCGFSRAPACSLAVSHLPAVGPQVVSSQR